MSEQNKIDEIKAEYQMAEELFKRQPQMRDKFNQTHDWIGYLLAEIERKDDALRFYADDFNWTGGYNHQMPALSDHGRRAWEAL
jgi:hypothetical protein